MNWKIVFLWFGSILIIVGLIFSSFTFWDFLFIMGWVFLIVVSLQDIQDRLRKLEDTQLNKQEDKK